MEASVRFAAMNSGKLCTIRRGSMTTIATIQMWPSILKTCDMSARHVTTKSAIQIVRPDAGADTAQTVRF